jgi:hypothetical protein
MVRGDVFVIMEVGTRRILHSNATMHPTGGWTLQQFRECVGGGEEYRFVVHDRDSIYSQELDQSLEALGLAVPKTPYITASEGLCFTLHLLRTIDSDVFNGPPGR